MEKVKLALEPMIDQRIELYTEHLKNLLAGTPIKYSSWPQEPTDFLRQSAGVYHFFEKNEETIFSLYVGKAGFGKKNWNLYKRLSQHFLISQKNTIIDKISKSTGQNPQAVKESLSNKEVYLQWVAVYQRTADLSLDIETDLIWIECFCKSMLKPKYTDA